MTAKYDVSRAEWTAEQLIADPTTTLSQAKGWLEVRFKKKGARCPACQQTVRRNERRVYSSIARGLVEMYQYIRRPETLNAWMHVGQHFLRNKIGAAKGGDIIKMRYWGLIERKPNEARRADGSDRVGMWRLTERGCRFVLNDMQVPKVALVYNNMFLGFKPKEGLPVKDFDEAMLSALIPKTSIVAALGKKFNFQEVMGMG